jgi:hypothetical protein
MRIAGIFDTGICYSAQEGMKKSGNVILFPILREASVCPKAIEITWLSWLVLEKTRSFQRVIKGVFFA